MIKPVRDIGPKKSLQFESDEDDIEDDDADDDLSDVDDGMSVDDDLSGADKVIDDELTSENGREILQDDLKRGDCVKVIKGNYLGYFAVVTGNGYGGEIEINYFKGKNEETLRRWTTSQWTRDHIIFRWVSNLYVSLFSSVSLSIHSLCTISQEPCIM